MKMPPTSAFMVQTSDTFEEPISRTYQYRKVMKPMLERKRRARINRCLDELKELMVTALQAEGENASKLEKADILELTVKHLHNLKRHDQLLTPETTYADRFRAGFTHCASEVSNFLTNKNDVDSSASAQLLHYLNACIRRFDRGVVAPKPLPSHLPAASVNLGPVNLINPRLNAEPSVPGRVYVKQELQMGSHFNRFLRDVEAHGGSQFVPQPVGRVQRFDGQSWGLRDVRLSGRPASLPYCSSRSSSSSPSRSSPEKKEDVWRPW